MRVFKHRGVGGLGIQMSIFTQGESRCLVLEEYGMSLPFWACAGFSYPSPALLAWHIPFENA